MGLPGSFFGVGRMAGRGKAILNRASGPVLPTKWSQAALHISEHCWHISTTYTWVPTWAQLGGVEEGSILFFRAQIKGLQSFSVKECTSKES